MPSKHATAAPVIERQCCEAQPLSVRAASVNPTLLPRAFANVCVDFLIIGQKFSPGGARPWLAQPFM